VRIQIVVSGQARERDEGPLREEGIETKKGGERVGERFAKTIKNLGKKGSGRKRKKEDVQDCLIRKK